MPTGYTSMIDENPNMTTKKWVMEGLARAFGICVTLRDDSMELTETQIQQRLIEDSRREINYHQTELDKAQKESKRLANRSHNQWKTAWSKYEHEKEVRNQQSVLEANKKLERHMQVRDDLGRVIGSDKVHEVTRDIAKFGVEQLKLVQSECLPYIEEPMELKGFITDKIKSNKRHIEYEIEEVAKAKERMEERIKLYERLKEDLVFLD